MKGYLVDTNVPSELTHETPDARVVAFLRKAGKESLFLSVMTLGEICKGTLVTVLMTSDPALRTFLFPPSPFGKSQTPENRGLRRPAASDPVSTRCTNNG